MTEKMNQKKLDKMVNKRVEIEDLPLLMSREKALKNKEHPYEYLKQNGFILDPVIEFY